MLEEMNEEKARKLFRNESGLEFLYIGESLREYHFPNGEELSIDNALFLNVSESGGHRVAAYNEHFETFTCYYIKPDKSWHIIWETMDDVPHFSK